VPITAKSIAAWMNSYAVTGLSSACEIKVSSANRKVQIASLTPGTEGSIQVQGGEANTVAAAVVGTATAMGYPVVSTLKADAVGLVSDAWVRLTNTERVTKQPFAGYEVDGTVITDISTAGLFSISNTATSQAIYFDMNLLSQRIWKVEKQGNFVCYSITTRDGALPDVSSVLEGDWLVVKQGTLVTGQVLLSDANAGTFRVLRKYSDTGIVAFWVENDNAVEEEAQCDVCVLAMCSIMPGDIVTINTAMFGVGNMGSWIVTASGTVGDLASDFMFQVDVSSKATTLYSDTASFGLANYNLFQVEEGLPATFIKKILAISPNATDGKYVDIKFTDSYMYEHISEVAGTVITSLDKLDFPIDIVVGINGYSHSVGLIAEATKVLYGDPADPAGYPGVVAAGANVNVSGPMVKRVSCAFALRVRSGVQTSDVADRVRSGVAAVINSTGIGQQIAISSLVAAASKVNGVVAVTVIDPVFGAGNDLISVQPYEKPEILNLETDITISFTGV
jgi:hypothetical protein